MITSIAIATSLLAVLSDDEDGPVDFEDRMQRALAFNNPDLVVGGMTEEERNNLLDALDAWILASDMIEEMAQRSKTFHFLFPTYRVRDGLINYSLKKKLSVAEFELVDIEDHMPSSEVRRIQKLIADGEVEVIDYVEEGMTYSQGIIAHDGRKLLLEIIEGSTPGFQPGRGVNPQRYDSVLIEIPEGNREERHRAILKKIDAWLHQERFDR